MRLIAAGLTLGLFACGETAGAGDGTGDGETGGSTGDGSDTTGVGETGELQCPEEALADCDPFAQDCPEGQKCSPYARDLDTWDADGCVPVADAAAEPGEPCHVWCGPAGGVDDCARGSMCWNVDADGAGTCVELCSGNSNDAMCSDEARVCSIYTQGVLPLCLATCDPVAQTCPDGEACTPGLYAHGAFVCLPTRDDPVGFAGHCEEPNDCASGMFCMIPAGVPGCQAPVGCCSEFCDLDDPGAGGECAGADGGQQCLPYFDNAPPPGSEHVGVCAIPPP